MHVQPDELVSPTLCCFLKVYKSCDVSCYFQSYDCLLNIESLEKKLIHVEEQERYDCNIELTCTYLLYYRLGQFGPFLFSHVFFSVACLKKCDLMITM